MDLLIEYQPGRTIFLGMRCFWLSSTMRLSALRYNLVLVQLIYLPTICFCQLKEVIALSESDEFMKPQPRRRKPPAKTMAAREQQLVASAYDLAEDLLDTGKAPAPVLMHFLKMGSSREVLEQEMIKKNIQFADAKIDAIAQQGRIEEMYGAAMASLRSYQGKPDLEEDD